ncbi:translation initiation factor IF-2 [Bombilactobacillus folatiphilus]|uniref:Translation initiation factor IF-2 n=1 Tax=Bombilactobacillus folatiphilus TaxID=2923362 RepID=A0ABY4P7F4_9LACO|nr:translation initiation factor IF-2 [Bombilactobacillus folatiphilus]UQS81582.1 translation initiation factor IF-2 [Bombilactobacillus folatiphilus]
MGKKRVYELAKELNIPSKDLVNLAQKHQMDIFSHMAVLDDKQLNELKKIVKQPTKSVKSQTKSSTAVNDDKSKGKTKIKVTAIRHTPKTNDTERRNQHSNQPTKPSTNNNHGARQDNNRTNNSNRANGNNNGPRRNNNQRQDRNFNSNNDHRSSMMNRASAGRKHLAQYKQNAQASVSSVDQARVDQARKQREQKARNNQAKKSAAKTSGNNHAQQRPQRPITQKPVAATTSAAKPKPANEKSANEKTRQHEFTNNRRKNEHIDYRNRPKHKNKRKLRKQQNNKPHKEMPKRKERPLPEIFEYSVGMNAQDLGKILHREPAEIVKKLFMLGVMVNQNQSLDKDTIEILAADYGIEANEKFEEDITDLDTFFEDEVKNTDNLTNRPPVVTIMGHVDHGKTTLLDNLRHSHVTAGEAGGITQHIGAYQVELDGRLITFLDTPGHAAFSNMRARGADITDIVILVVAADDGVMPQTIEAINHAKAAGDPIIVAINKIDKPDANPQHVTEELMNYGLIPESYGGDTIFANISAKQGTGIDDLLQMVLLEADVLELKANSEQRAVGTVIEARLDKGRGPVASLLVQQGTLKKGDPIVVGNTFGRVRVMTDDRGRQIEQALPSQPVMITGLNEVPQSADKFVVFADEKTARSAGEERAKRAQIEERKRTNAVTLDNLFDAMKQNDMKKVDVVIKGDVQGSVEALRNSLEKIDVEGVRVNIIHAAVGAINESDVTLASASNAIIIGFNVRPTVQAKIQADSENVDIRLHNVIYNAIDEIESAMKGMLEPVYEEKVTGNLTVRETYKVSKLGTIAGCIVDNGLIQKDSGVRLIRNGIVIYEGKLASLKRFKDDVKEVKQGFECGLMIEDYNDIKVDDQIEAYIMQEVPVQ